MTAKKLSIDDLVNTEEFLSIKSKDDRLDWLTDNGIKASDARTYLASVARKPVDQMPLLVKIFREEPDRKSALKRASIETEYTESTINHFYNAKTFAIEWSKQSAETI
jgi:hypothetical protein